MATVGVKGLLGQIFWLKKVNRITSITTNITFLAFYDPRMRLYELCHFMTLYVPTHFLFICI